MIHLALCALDLSTRDNTSLKSSESTFCLLEHPSRFIYKKIPFYKQTFHLWMMLGRDQIRQIIRHVYASWGIQGVEEVLPDWLCWCRGHSWCGLEPFPDYLSELHGGNWWQHQPEKKIQEVIEEDRILKIGVRILHDLIIS